MNKTVVKVPKDIKYLSDWEDFRLPEFPCIIDKKLTGCGFTEFVIRGNFNAVLVSPRKILLQNKADQHNPKKELENGTKVEIPEERVIYYARCKTDNDLEIDKDLNSKFPKLNDNLSTSIDEEVNYLNFSKDLEEAIKIFQLYGKPIKIAVTYDSFRKVKEILIKLGILDTFYIIVDEMQSIFTDSKFKASTELDFIDNLQSIKKVSYVSATPMMENYLNKIDEFKDLDYLELDWKSEDPSRIITPDLIHKECRRINEVAKKIITEFKAGKYEKKILLNSEGNPSKLVEARELVFYVNSVKNICDIIRQNNLLINEVNVLCADTKDNQEKVRKAFRTVYNTLKLSTSSLPKADNIIGSIPLKGEPNKPITFCTKTVYLGADFYSKCARTIILSDANIDCLAVDITLDEPQILGRQRDDENPWKYSAEVWFKSGSGKGQISKEEFERKIQYKLEESKSLLLSYESSPTSESKNTLTKIYEKVAKVDNYKDNYIGISYHTSSNKYPKINYLVMIAEQRAFDIQQVDYADRFSVFNKVSEVFGEDSISESREIQNIIDEISNYTTFSDRLKKCIDIITENSKYLKYIPSQFKVYIDTLGIDFIKRSSYRKYHLDEAIENRKTDLIFTSDNLEEIITKFFEDSNETRWSKKELKEILGDFYSKLGIPSKPKASDLEKWYELKEIRMTVDGKRIPGFELIKKI